MTRNRKPKRRPIFLESLESRWVPSSAASTAAAAAAAYQTEYNELTQLNSQMNPAFATFAGSVFQAETTFYSSTAGAASGTATSPTTAMSTFQSSVSQAITTLQSTLLPTFNVLSGSTANLTNQVQAQLTGASTGSLSNVMTSLLGAASVGTSDGSVPSASLPLLFQAMNNSIGGAYSSVAVDAYYFVTGQAYDSSGNIIPNTDNNTTSSFNLNTVQGLQNTAWATAASSLFTATSGLQNTDGNATGSPITTGATVSTEATQAVNTLAQSIVSSFNSTPASGNTGPIEALLDGPASGSLATQLTSLISVAASNSDGSVPSTSLPLLYTAIDDAIESSYNATAVSSFLLAVSPVYLPGGAGTNT